MLNGATAGFRADGIPLDIDDRVGGTLQIVDRMQDTAPFVLPGGSMDGCLTRLSTSALLNVTAGGGSTVPSFVVEERT